MEQNMVKSEVKEEGIEVGDGREAQAIRAVRMEEARGIVERMEALKEKQARLKGMWLELFEGCPHRMAYWYEEVDRCEMNEMRVCVLECGEHCDMLSEIIAEWAEEYERRQADESSKTDAVSVTG